MPKTTEGSQNMCLGIPGRIVEIIDEEPRRGAGGSRMVFVHPRGAFGVLTELVELPHA